MGERQCGNPLHAALFTDLYELTMAQAYARENLNDLATFELFFRTMPDSRNYMVAAGLDDVLDSLERLQVTDGDIQYLRSRKQFSEEFLERLKQLRFTGDVYAPPEGTIIFPYEPLLQVVAPIWEAQLIETLALNQIHFQTVVATKAARIVTAARGRTVVDFGSRRAHGADAALKVARTSYLAGAAGTSNVLAGQVYGIPIFGTMAHSYVEVHVDEMAAFEFFVEIYPETTLLVDTYETLQGVRTVVELSRKMGERFRVGAIRLDSGNLLELSKQSRALLDEAGLQNVRIIASSGLDEYKIAELLAEGAPIDGFGVGTKLAIADGAAQLDMAYKLVEYAGQPKMKLSSEKATYPGRKQVFRMRKDGMMAGDAIGLHDERLPGEPLLQPVMRGGQRLPAGRVSLDDIRLHAQRELEALPARLRKLTLTSPQYSVRRSDRLQSDFVTLQRQLTASHL